MDSTDNAMLERDLYITERICGVELADIETVERWVIYGLSSWPSHCETLMLYKETYVEWDRDKRMQAYRKKAIWNGF